MDWFSLIIFKKEQLMPKLTRVGLERILLEIFLFVFKIPSFRFGNSSAANWPNQTDEQPNEERLVKC